MTEVNTGTKSQQKRLYEGPSVVGKIGSSLANIVSSSAYAAIGTALAVGGAYAMYYTVTKVNHFARGKEGLGDYFKMGCDTVLTEWLKTESGALLCEQMSTNGFSEISGTDMQAAAVAVAAISSSLTLWVGFNGLVRGLSLIGSGISKVFDNV